MSSDPASPRQKILIVEDETLIAADLKVRVEKLGYAVCGVARTGENALKLVEATAPDMVLIDIVLAGDLDGIESARQIRNKWRTPVIFVTSHADETYLSRAKEVRPFGYLIKPFQDHDLRVTLEISLYVAQAERQRRLVEEALQVSEKRFRLLFETSSDAHFVHPLDENGNPGRFVEVNETACRRLGYTREELLRMTPVDIGLPENAGRVAEMGWRLLKDGAALFETVHKSRDGRLIPVESNVRTFEFQGQTSVLSIARDITERRRTQEALRQSEAKYRSLVENVSDVAFRTDRQGRLQYISPAVEKKTGFSPAEYLGQPFSDFVHQADLAYLKESIGSRRKMSDTPVEFRTAKVDGGFIWVSASSQLFIEDGKPVGLTGVCRDVTERRLAQEALAASERRLRSLYAAMVEGVCLHEVIRDETGQTIDYRIIDVNPSFESTIGVKRDQVIGLLASEFYGTGEPPYLDIYTKVVDTGRPTAFETYFQPMDKYFSVSVFSPAGGQFATVFQDITDRKKAEAEKERLEERLRQAHKMEAMGTLAGGVAHDFNNILAAMIGYTELAAFDLPADHPSRSHLRNVLAAGQRAKKLVGQILTFSRHSDRVRQEVEVRDVVEECLGFLRATLPTTIEIREGMSARTSSVLADPTQVHQIVMNLGTNAGQAMPNGGVLSLELDNVELDELAAAELTGVAPGPYLRLTVSDTGHGMDQEILQRVFDPFFTTKELGQGTGMGLAVVHGIVRGLGGDVTVASEKNHGSLFTVYLPLFQGQNRAEADSIELPIKGRGESILLVDDETDLAEIGRRWLERMGYRVTALTSAREALELFLARPLEFDLVITDQTMPGLTGCDLCQRVMAIRPDIPVILCSGYSQQITAEEARNMGVKRFLFKPMDFHELARAIREVLENKRS